MDVENTPASDMGVAFGGTKAGVTEEGLDITNVGTAFQKMSGKRVAQTVNRDFFRGFLHGGRLCRKCVGRQTLLGVFAPLRLQLKRPLK